MEFFVPSFLSEDIASMSPRSQVIDKAGSLRIGPLAKWALVLISAVSGRWWRLPVRTATNFT